MRACIAVLKSFFAIAAFDNFRKLLLLGMEPGGLFRAADGTAPGRTDVPVCPRRRKFSLDEPLNLFFVIALFGGVQKNPKILSEISGARNLACRGQRIRSEFSLLRREVGVLNGLEIQPLIDFQKRRQLGTSVFNQLRLEPILKRIDFQNRTRLLRPARRLLFLGEFSPRPNRRLSSARDSCGQK